jgi:ribonuclease HI
MKAKRLHILDDPKKLWYILPPPHPMAGVYSGNTSLRKAGVLVRPPCPIPEEERWGFAKTMEAWFRRYEELPVIGIGKSLYRPEDYPKKLKEKVIALRRRHRSLPDAPKEFRVKIRVDGSKGKEGGFGAVALARGKVAAFAQGGATRKDLTAQDMELLALVQGLVLGIATDEPFVVETDNTGLLDRLTGTGRTASPLEAAARALLAVAREAGLYQGLRRLERKENKKAHKLANKARRALEKAHKLANKARWPLEKEEGAFEVLLRLLPSAQRPWAIRYLKRLASLEAGALEALASLGTKTAKALLAIAEEAPEVFAKALEEAKASP